MQRLLGQHLDLLHQEIRDDLRKTKEAVLSIGIAGVLAIIAALILIPALVGFLSSAVPAVPWWGWCGILGGVFAVIAGVLYSAGKRKLASFNPLPEQSVKAVKENLQWISDRVTEPR
jgi:MFS family permease